MTNSQTQKKAALQIAIIGGGPAGLMAADRLSQSGFAVTIYDRMPTVGRKFLMAGRGGLNLTHNEDFEHFMARYNESEDWLRGAIENFSPRDTRAFCSELDISTFVGTSGRIFPDCFKTSPLLRAWLDRLRNQGVEFRLRHSFTGWDDKGDLRFETPDGDVNVFADATLLACGGGSWPRLGSDGSWTTPLAGKGVAINPLKPANCGFVAQWPERFSSKYAGAPLKPIRASFAGIERAGECVVTAGGLEGGVIYALSALLRDAIIEKGEAILALDLKPDVTEAVLIQRLTERLAATSKKQSTSNRLRKAARLSPVAIALLRLSQKELAQPEFDPGQLASKIKNLPVRLTGTQPITRAISTAGGVYKDTLDKNFMLKKIPGIFCAGEMLDWEAPTGGYLLQACFATGAAAAEGIKSWIAEQSSAARTIN